MKFKKVAALFMVVCMALGTIACGNNVEEKQSSAEQSSEKQSSAEQSSAEEQEESSVSDAQESEEPEERPFEGETLKVVYPFSLKDQYQNVSELTYAEQYELVYVALNEWCERNGATWEEQVLTEEQLIAACTSGQSPDLVFGWEVNGFPYVQANGGGEVLTDYYDQFADRNASDCVEQGWFNGEWYGTFLPYTRMSMMRYDKKYFEMRGVKSPDEYFMEGNWTWEAFQTVCKEISGDTDGDGTIDTLAYNSWRMDESWARPWIYDKDENKYICCVGNEENRALYQMAYELRDVLTEEGDKTGAISDGSYLAIGYSVYCGGIVPTIDLSVEEKSETAMYRVPIPAYSEDKAYISERGYFMHAAKGGNTEMAVSVMKDILDLMIGYTKVEAKLATVEEALGWFEPTTELGISLLNQAKAVSEVDWKVVYEERRGISLEYLEALAEYTYNTPHKYMMGGPTSTLFVGDNREKILGAPSATSTAELLPIIEDQVATRNAEWLGQ